MPALIVQLSEWSNRLSAHWQLCVVASEGEHAKPRHHTAVSWAPGTGAPSLKCSRTLLTHEMIIRGGKGGGGGGGPGWARGGSQAVRVRLGGRGGQRSVGQQSATRAAAPIERAARAGSSCRRKNSADRSVTRSFSQSVGQSFSQSIAQSVVLSDRLIGQSSARRIRYGNHH